MKSGNLNFLEPSGHSKPVTGLLYLYLYLKLYYILNLTAVVTELSHFSDFPYLVPIFTAKREIKEKYTWALYVDACACVLNLPSSRKLQ